MAATNDPHEMISNLFSRRSESALSHTFVIAEAGVNHNGDLDLAMRLVDVAADAGADAVKFQTFKARRLVSGSAPKADYQKLTTDAAESQFEMLQRLELSDENHRQLFQYCAGRGIAFISTPFDESSADFLAALGVPLFKIPSGEITNIPFLAHVAKIGLPIIVSTGMAYLGEVEAAVRTIEDAGNSRLALLHCVSNYPAAASDANLRAMYTMSNAFGLPVGYSDHTEGQEVALAAVALGACIIEKHFTLDRELPGPDQSSSVEPDELAALVRGIRTVEAALGHGRKEPAPSEANTMAVARKSLVASRNIAEGEMITEEMIAIKRPGTGLPPGVRSMLINRIAKIAISEGTLLSFENVG
jgi:N,N'-diacetyllegionaminate synthase